MSDAERLIILRNAINYNDVTIDHNGVHCAHRDCNVCIASGYCSSFPASNHYEWLQGSNAFLERVKYHVPSLHTLIKQYPEYFI